MARQYDGSVFVSDEYLLEIIECIRSNSDSEGKPLIDCNYFIFFEDGEVESGKTNSRGETHLIETEMSKKFYIHFNKDFDSDLNFQEEF